MQALFKPGTRARAQTAGPAVRIKDTKVNSVQSQGRPIAPAREAEATCIAKHPDRVRRAQVDPVLGRVVVEGQEHVEVVADLGGCFGPLDAVLGREILRRRGGVVFIFSVPDLGQG